MVKNSKETYEIVLKENLKIYQETHNEAFLYAATIALYFLKFNNFNETDIDFFIISSILFHGFLEDKNKDEAIQNESIWYNTFCRFMNALD